MQIIVFSMVVMALYLITATQQFLAMRGQLKHGRVWLNVLGYPAILLYAYLLHLWIDVGTGQNLTVLNMFSLLAWLASLFVLIASIRRQVQGMLVVVFGVAALSIILVDLFAGSYVVETRANPAQLFHILFAVITVTVLCLAALQALILAVQVRQLRLHHSHGVWRKLPSLETMEAVLFQMIWLGFILLTLLIGSSFYAYGQQVIPRVMDKTILVILAWGVFGLLLFGRHAWGWRGRRAIHFTLTGVGVLTLTYFGSQWMVIS